MHVVRLTFSRTRKTTLCNSLLINDLAIRPPLIVQLTPRIKGGRVIPIIIRNGLLRTTETRCNELDFHLWIFAATDIKLQNWASRLFANLSNKPYALSIPVEPQTTFLRPVLSSAAASIFFQLYLNPVVPISDSRSLLQVFRGRSLLWVALWFPLQSKRQQTVLLGPGYHKSSQSHVVRHRQACSQYCVYSDFDQLYSPSGRQIQRNEYTGK